MTEETAKLNKEISEKLTDEIIIGYNIFFNFDGHTKNTGI